MEQTPKHHSHSNGEHHHHTHACSETSTQGHHHSHSHACSEASEQEHSHSHSIHVHGLSKNLAIAFALNLVFTLIEFAGGIWTQSIAIWSDAIHDLGDTCAIGLALFLERLSNRKSDSKYSYGYQRFSSLSALIVSGVLIAGSVFILVEAIPRLFNPTQVHETGMIGLAILGVVVNGAAVLQLKSGSNSHNQRAVMLHLFEDVLGWIAVLGGALIIWLTDWYIIDPILSIAIAFYILFNASKNLKGILKIFLQATPNNISVNEIKAEMENLPEVLSVHDINIWTMDGEKHVLSCHVVLAEEFMSLQEATAVKEKLRNLLSYKGISHLTIEIEHEHQHGH
ncbi:MAG: cation transporter [Bacteroidetes bacterium]|nr:cation transporter [Bacteroidota bacterium]